MELYCKLQNSSPKKLSLLKIDTQAILDVGELIASSE